MSATIQLILILAAIFLAVLIAARMIYSKSYNKSLSEKEIGSLMLKRQENYMQTTKVPGQAQCPIGS